MAIQHYIIFLNKQRNRIDRPEVKGVAKEKAGLPIEMPPITKTMTTKPILLFIQVQFL